MTGEELYAAWCAALFVNWPSSRKQQFLIFGEGTPPAPVAWPFVNEYTQKGWEELAEALTRRAEEDAS
jgi:hemolysin-activating ACP:hemolysin acyltransferase